MCPNKRCTRGSSLRAAIDWLRVFARRTVMIRQTEADVAVLFNAQSRIMVASETIEAEPPQLYQGQATFLACQKRQSFCLEYMIDAPRLICSVRLAKLHISTTAWRMFDECQRPSPPVSAEKSRHQFADHRLTCPRLKCDCRCAPITVYPCTFVNRAKSQEKGGTHACQEPRRTEAASGAA